MVNYHVKNRLHLLCFILLWPHLCYPGNNDSLFSKALETWSNSFIVFKYTTNTDTLKSCALTSALLFAIAIEQKFKNKKHWQKLAIDFATSKIGYTFHFTKPRALKLISVYNDSAFNIVRERFGNLTQRELREKFKLHATNTGNIPDSSLLVCNTLSEMYSLARLLFESGLLPYTKCEYFTVYVK